MKNKFFKQRSFYAVFLSVVLSVVLVAGAAGAATTISTNITTGGTLTVSGVTTLSGIVNVGDATSGDDDRVYLYGTTTVIGAQAFVFGSSSEVQLSGQEAGSVYYDSTNRILRLYSGSAWHALASSTDAAGGLVLTDGTLRIQFNDLATNYMTLGTTTQDILDADASANGNGAMLTLQASSTTATPLRILSASTTPGTVNLLAVLNSGDGSELFVIDGVGHASTTGSFQVGAIGNTSTSLFSVGGNATTTATNGNFAMEGALTVNGNATLGSAVTDTVTINGSATTTNSLTIGPASDSGAFLYVSGMATTTGSSGALSIQGSLTVNGTTTAPTAGGISVTGDLQLNSSGTTTLKIGTSDASAEGDGGCIEIQGISNTGIFHITASTTGDYIFFEAGGCK